MENILFEDNHLIVIDKPWGIAVQGDDLTAKQDLIRIVKDYLIKSKNKKGEAYLGTVHRLDQAVSGVLIFAKTSKAAKRLTDQFKEKSITKEYLALVIGSPEKKEGTLTHRLKKRAHKSWVLSSASKDGRVATLSYRTLFSKNNRSLLLIQPKTAFYHQIRCQLSHQKIPIEGDVKYGAPCPLRRGQIHLHCFQMKVTHPTLKSSLTFTSMPPENWDMCQKEFDVIYSLC